MKIAVPIWNNRISPLFDTACRVLIWSVEGGRYGEWEEHDLQELIPAMKVCKIKELGTDVLICGAVSNPIAYLVESAGIKLVPWVSGPVDEVLEAFQTGQLDRPRYFMPGCRWRGRGRRGRGASGRMRAGAGSGQSGAGRGRAGTRQGQDTVPPPEERRKKKGDMK
jgi:predicted Fe-Mo cluster-binding NifX family protein